MASPSADDSVSVPWRSRTLQVVLASTLLAPLGVPLVSPALPVLRDALGLTDARASLVVSAYFATGIVLSPFIGLVADRLGRRRVLVPSLFAFSLSGGAVLLAPGFRTVLALRVVQGIAAAGVLIATVTLVGDAFSGVQRNAVLGVNVAVLSAGAAVYPVVGGALATVGWRAPFAVTLVGLPVGLFALRALEEPPGARDARGLDYLRRVVSAVPAVEALAVYGAALVSEVLLFGSVFTAIPFLLAEEYGASPVFVGLVVTASALTAGVVASQNGRLARRLPNEALVAAAFACYAVGLVGTWFAPTPLLVGVAVLPIGAAAGLNMPSVDAAVSALVPAEFRAGALSLRNSMTFLGRTVGPLLFAGLAVRGVGYRTLLLAGGLGALAAFLLSLLLTHGRASRRAEAA